VKLHYRAPELLLGCQSYGPPIDLWVNPEGGNKMMIDSHNKALNNIL